MKVLSAAAMREVDRRTIEMGVPGIVLMENAGQRVVEFLMERYAPLTSRRVVVFCGKGNNGGDGMVIARQLYTRALTASLDVILLADPAQLSGDAATNYRMLEACGCPIEREIAPRMRAATLVIDALLGTGLTGPAKGAMLEAIHEINTGFPLAAVVSVDIPSGLPSDSPEPVGESVRAGATVTFTAPKIGQVLPPNCDRTGDLRIVPIGSPAWLYEDDPANWLTLVESARLAPLFAPRAPAAHKGSFGHVLVVGGSKGKTGAAAMAGMAALRSGAGLVTVASVASAIPVIASYAPELMAEPLEETESGGISLRSFDYGRMAAIMESKDVLAVGPGMGTHPDTVALVRRLFLEDPRPMVIDADGLNALAGADWIGAGKRRVLTPHPGEMGRLAAISTAAVQAGRVDVARAFAQARGVVVVLKGQRTLIAFPDGRVWVNPTGTPAMATGGTGDILTGLIAGLLGQFPREPDLAVAAAVYLHGRAGELGARELGEAPLIATDLLRFLPRAIKECVGLSNHV